MANVLGVNGVFHDPAAALVVDGEIVAAAEEERFSRRKHGKTPVPFSTWELPEQAIAFCLARAGLGPGDLDAVAYSYDPDLAPPASEDITADEWEGLRTLFVRRAPRFLAATVPGLDPGLVRFVPHHVAHAASAYLAAPFPSSAAVVAGASLVLCGDTGVAHLAYAFDTPAVVRFGPVSPAEWGPAAAGRQAALWAGRSGDPNGQVPHPGLLEISVADVLAAVSRVDPTATSGEEGGDLVQGAVSAPGGSDSSPLSAVSDGVWPSGASSRG